MEEVYHSKKITMIYRKIATIEAMQFDPKKMPWPEGVKPWPKIKDGFAYQPRDMSFGYVETLEGEMHVQAGDWIATGIEGEKWPIKDSIFKKTYELVE